MLFKSAKRRRIGGKYLGYFGSKNAGKPKSYRKKKPKKERIPRFKIFPKIMDVCLRYNNAYHYTGNPRQTNIFSGNSIFQCDVTGGAGQPMLHDELEAIYENYQVYASAIEVKVVNSSTEGALIVVLPHNDATAYTNSPRILEQDLAKSIVIGSDNAHDTDGITCHMRTKDLYPGLTGKEIDLHAGMSGNPVIRWYWHLYAEDIPVAAALDLYLNVTIRYYVRLYSKQSWPLS